MHLTRPRSFRPHDSVHFESVSELPSRVEPRRRDGQAPPYYGFVTCPRTDGLRSLDDCVHCRHFVNLRPTRAACEATVRCLCSHEDALTDEEPLASTWRMVEPDMPVALARLLAATEELSLLVVAQDENVLGVIYADQLGTAGDGTVDACMARPWCLPPTATVGEAVEAMRELQVAALLIVDADHELVSVVARTDLRRLGVPTHLLR